MISSRPATAKSARAEEEAKRDHAAEGDAEELRGVSSEEEEHPEAEYGKSERRLEPGVPFDYYKTLGIGKSADQGAIRKAYRRLALKFHPERNQDPDSKGICVKVAEAYDVLSDGNEKRAVYDQYGPAGLEDGVPPREGYLGFKGGYKFHGNAEQVFVSFFGGKNPFEDFFSVHTETGKCTAFGPRLGGMHGMNPKHNESSPTKSKTGGLPRGPMQSPPVEKFLEVTLEELYLGTVKKMKVTRKVFNEDQTTTTQTDKVLTIHVKRGWKDGTRVTFPKEGDQGPNIIPADIVFIIKQLPHPYFVRQGDELVHTLNLTLGQALCGTIVDLVTLDGRRLKIPVHEVMRPDYVKEVQGEGMPLSKSPDVRGKLLMKFKIEFPVYLNEEQKRMIRKALETKTSHPMQHVRDPEDHRRQKEVS
ncbi:hypothetical protein BJ742DRAFT_672112 [Cladochytrium replicatum]|nr:hypothetical protein BJ742DRAFT_672112 [Cladochytrium replicatum]